MTVNDQSLLELNAPDVVERVNCYASAIGIDAAAVRAISGRIDEARQNYPRSDEDELFLGRDGKLGAGELGGADTIIGAFERIKEKHRLYGTVISADDELALLHMSDGLRPLAEGEALQPHERRVSLVAGSGGVRFSPHYLFDHDGQLLHKPGSTELEVAPVATPEEYVAVDRFYTKLVGHFAVDPTVPRQAFDPRSRVPLVQPQCREAVTNILDSIVPGMKKLAGEHNLSEETKAALEHDLLGLGKVIGAFCQHHDIPRNDAVPASKADYRSKAALGASPAMR